MNPKTGPLPEFTKLIEFGAPDECWRWRGNYTTDGYGTYGWHRAHRKSWERFKGQSIRGRGIVRHSCDHRWCVNPAHLLIGDHSDNVRDRVERDRSAKGERNGRSVLTQAQVDEIRSSRLTRRELAEAYGVSARAISKIINRETWK
jgi:hypothetical protein